MLNLNEPSRLYIRLEVTVIFWDGIVVELNALTSRA
jgi:hypothetical protein